MKLTLIITPKQAAKILHSIPVGSSIKISVKDANKILDKKVGNKNDLL